MKKLKENKWNRTSEIFPKADGIYEILYNSNGLVEKLTHVKYRKKLNKFYIGQKGSEFFFSDDEVLAWRFSKNNGISLPPRHI